MQDGSLRIPIANQKKMKLFFFLYFVMDIVSLLVSMDFFMCMIGTTVFVIYLWLSNDKYFPLFVSFKSTLFLWF